MLLPSSYPYTCCGDEKTSYDRFHKVNYIDFPYSCRGIEAVYINK